MTLNTKRTIYGSALQTAQMIGATHRLLPNSTLNTKFDILKDETLSKNPNIAYYAIGNGGHENYPGEDGQALTRARVHSARHAALFKHLPFVMRETTNDLDELTRAKYALRTIEEFDGVNYYCYWLKRIDLSEVPVNTFYSVTDGDSTTTDPFIPSPEDLNPVPGEIPSEGVVAASGEELTAQALIDINFDAGDAEELLKVCRIRFKNELYATVSEIALCSGEDKEMPVTPPQGLPYNFLEAIGVQVNMHISCLYSIHFSNSGFDLRVDLGASEPLTVGSAAQGSFGTGSISSQAGTNLS